MARRVEVQLIDDLDGGKAEETVAFSFEGVNYEIDLSAKHAAKLRSGLARYVEAGRRLGRGRVATAAGAGRGSVPARVDRSQNQAIREWARRKKIQLSDRGRIPRHVVEQYQAEAGR